MVRLNYHMDRAVQITETELLHSTGSCGPGLTTFLWKHAVGQADRGEPDSINLLGI